MNEDRNEQANTIGRKAAFWFFTLLLMAGIVMYVGWGLQFGTWNLFTAEAMGVYSIVVVLVSFGIFGMLIYRK